MSYSTSPLRFRVDDGPWHNTRGQKARVLRFWWGQRDRWRRVWDAVLALQSDEVKARMADLKRDHKVELFDQLAGLKETGLKARKLYRLKPTVEVQDGETANG